MIEFSRFELANGLRVLVHEDDTTPMATVNVLYNVGARDELPDKTGFAHLFEHLMFGGSLNVPDFDDPIQLAGGENNAFTNNDMTNFYDTLPAQNIETAFWLESDRMLSLNFDDQVLDVQRKVVVEEFKETCLNEPYGDMMHLLSDMVYKRHPYRWPTIGLAPSHIEGATMPDVKQFFFRYYRPNNAILVVSGNVKTDQIRTLAEKWFGDIPRGETFSRNLPEEPEQTEFRQLIKEANVPVDAIYLAFRMAARTDPDFYVADLLSDILCTGPSSRLYRHLLKERQLFSGIDCFVSAFIDPGLFIIEGKPAEGVSLETASAAIWEELEKLKTELITPPELQKIKNKAESNLVFSEMSALNKAINLAFFELLGDPDLINKEAQIYQQISAADIQRVAQQMLRRENCSQLCYVAKPVGEPVEN
ncbi:MAG: insulinase family protein [Saprospiraceae bacterium]|nr:insulinase family protein [Saprospiraceae bacterium]